MKIKLLVEARRRIGRRHAPLFLLLLALALLISLGQLQDAAAQEPLEPPAIPDAHDGLPLFAERCANCHGPAGEGNGEMSASLPQPPRDFTDDTFRRAAIPSVMFQTISEGILESGMPPFGDASSNPISIVDRWNLVATVYTLGTPPQVLEAGQAVYEESCASCHGEGGAGDGPDAASSEAATPDLTDLRYWYNRSNEMVLEAMNGVESADHAYQVAGNDLWDVIDYARTFSYVYADPAELNRPIESAAISGMVQNGTTNATIGEGMVTLRAFTPDLQEALSETTLLGPDGRYQFELSEAGPDWVYMTSVDYGDLGFSSDPQRLVRSNPQLEMPITVFDATQDPSAINLNQVHMIMDLTEDLLRISEIYVVSNIEPAVFVGKSGEPDEGTLQLAVPAGAQNVEFQRSFRSFDNFLPAPEVIPTEEGYADTIPIRPGDGAMNLFVSYELPLEEGMSVEHPVFYNTSNATIVLPDFGLEITGEGWTSQGSQQMGNAGSVLSYSRPALNAGESVSFNLEGRIAAPARVGGGNTLDTSTSGLLLGGFVLLLTAGGAAWTISRWRTTAEEEAEQQHERTNALLAAVADLDERFEAGDMEEPAYEERRAALMQELAEIWVIPDPEAY